MWEDELAPPSTAVRTAGGEVAPVIADLASPAPCPAPSRSARTTWGPARRAVQQRRRRYHGGGWHRRDDRPRAWDLAQDVNVRAMYLVSRAAVPAMRAAAAARSSTRRRCRAFRGSMSRPTHAYAASKGAVLALTHAMAASYGRDRIRRQRDLSRHDPDPTDRGHHRGRGAGGGGGRGIPLGRVGEPEDIARCALFLASDDVAWISGAEIVVVGGALAATSGATLSRRTHHPTGAGARR